MEQINTNFVVTLILQLAVILFAVRIFGKLAQKIGIPTVLGELISGIVIGPYALGSIGFPGFENGLFPQTFSNLSVSPELYAIAQIAAIIMLFSSGLETDLELFLKYSVTGGIIGLGGVVGSFVLGDVVSMIILHTGFMDVRCLFLGIMSTATSVGITARILSERKKMESPEGVTVLAAAVFDDVLGIVLLAIVMGIVGSIQDGAAISVKAILLISAKTFGLWVSITLVCILLSKKIARFLRLFGGTFDFSITALGFAFLMAGFFEQQGLAMIIGAYTMGLSLSNTDIAPVIQERIYGLYKFFVPVFFAVMGMGVDVSQLLNRNVLLFGTVFTLVAIISKILGCGLPALGLGFNLKGALRVGAGMIPRGEVALIIAGIGLTAGIINQQLFGVVILMTLVTTIIAPPLLSASLKISGRGTVKENKDDDELTFEWDFGSPEAAFIAMSLIIRKLRAEKFFVQMMNINSGFFSARKNFISINAHTEEGKLVLQTAAEDMNYVKDLLYEVLKDLNKAFRSIEALKLTTGAEIMTKK